MNKVDHLYHVEDLCLFSQAHAAQALAALTNGKKCSIKFDGAPALIFGLGEDDRFFLSTKSYFNKTPKINYTIEDIHRNHKDGLAEKLESIFPKMQRLFENYECPDKFSRIYQGDLLFSEAVTDKTFTPNVIKYQFKEHKEHDLGIAIHTYYDSDGKNNRVTTNNSTSCGDFYIPETVVIPPKVFVTDAVNAYLHTPDYKKDPANALKEINGLIRNRIEINEQSLSATLNKYNYCSNVIRLYLEVLKVKNVIIGNLNSRTKEQHDLLTFVNGSECGHEGYVFECPNGSLTKLVDREVFSYNNFEKNG